MGAIVVQFNKKREESIFENYMKDSNDNEISIIDIENNNDFWINDSIENIENVLDDNKECKIIQILHDKVFGKAAIFINGTENEGEVNYKVFKKVAEIDIEICEELFKNIHVVKINSSKYTRVHVSEFFDQYHKLLSIEKEKGFGRPSMSIRDEYDGVRSIACVEKDRIIYSDMYKRLVDKAQIYSARKSIYLRNRLTHTNEVVSIAESITLGLNQKCNSELIDFDLVRAIAFGHDIGHTPFGHAGERAIEDWLERIHTDFRYFKHNYNGVRAVTYIEESYPEFFGLNLRPKVCAGILAHTSISKKHRKSGTNFNDFKNYIGTYFNFYNEEYNDKIFESVGFDEKKQLYCKFIEGQVVAIADEIAKRDMI